MESSDRVKQIFTKSAELQNESVNILAKSISDAAQNIANCFLDNNKLLICGNGNAAALAQLLTDKLINRYEYPRPGLPAILLNNNISTIFSIANDTQYSEIFSKQIRALGNSGDILVIVSSDKESPCIFEAIDAAHEREMRIISINATENEKLDITIQYDDIYISVINDSISRVQEIQLIIIHCICDLIDRQLLGLEG